MLAILLPSPGDLLQQMREGVDAVAVSGAAMLLAVSAVVWALVAWGVVVSLTAGLCRAPGAAGRIARAMLRATTPAVARRVLVLAAGVSVMAGASACAGPGSGTGAAHQPSVAVSAPQLTGATAPSTGPAYPDGGYAGPGSNPTRTSTAGNTAPGGGRGSPTAPASSPGRADDGASSAYGPSSDADAPGGAAGTTTTSPTVESAPPLLDLDWPTTGATADSSTVPQAATAPATGTAQATGTATVAETATAGGSPTTSARASGVSSPTTTSTPSVPTTDPAPGVGDQPGSGQPDPTGRAHQTSSPAPIPTPAATPASTGTPSTTPTPKAPTLNTPTANAPAPSSPDQDAPHRPHPRHGTPAEQGAPSQDTVTVRAGDTLWAIAARHLPAGASPAQIDRAWRGWYAANRSEIGNDPNLILPGQQLTAPTTERNSS